MSNFEFTERELHPDGYKHCEECNARIDPDEEYCTDCLEEIEADDYDDRGSNWNTEVA